MNLQQPSVSTETVVAFIVLGILANLGVEAIANRVGVGAFSFGETPELRRFHATYLAAYLCAVMADWLQGPYVYALYESYGFSRTDNALLFVCGFGASAVLGTYVGSMADVYGRRKFGVLYCAFYMVSCLTKHVNSFACLIIGRITGGVATSLLFSVFDAWLASEHANRGFDPSSLGNSFGLAMFWNSVMAIVAGELGEAVSEVMDLKRVSELGRLGQVYIGGYTAPFDMAIVFLCGAAAFLAFWPENYGKPLTESPGARTPRPGTPSESANAAKDAPSGFSQAQAILAEQPAVLAVGLVCAFFESSMFIFIFNWTPLVTGPTGPKPPYGHIFAAFMVMAMLGSRIFTLITHFVSVARVGFYAVLLGTVSNAAVLLLGSPFSSFLAFLLFELCIGMYFPMMGTMKAQLVPEHCRSTLYNIFRLPLNAIVVSSLVFQIGTRSSFFVTTILLAAAAGIQRRISNMEEVERFRPGSPSYHRPGSPKKAEEELVELVGYEATSP